MIQLKQVTLPDFGMPESFPQLPVAEYNRRLDAAVERMTAEGLDMLVVYADREHFANMAYLTGFDPRFEEALLLLDHGGKRWLLAGNECMGYLPDPALGCEPVLFQEFSLLGQPRGNSTPLRQIFAEFGIKPGLRIGTVGWKYYAGLLTDPAAIEIPAYLVDLLREMTGGPRNVRNATAIFMNNEDGLRVINTADQLAQFEYAACVTSNGVLALLQHIREGVAENELERWMDACGLPLSCHRMMSFGEKAKRGLASAGDNRARLGDPYTVAFGVNGALTCRAGEVARGPQDLPADLANFYPRYAENFFAVIAAWFATVKVGATGGEVFAAVEAVRNPALYDFALNPGHSIHLDEWVNSPFAAGNTTPLRSGMALQMDIIPVSKGPFCYLNAEDGLALADAGLRQEIAGRFPGCWARIQARRRFMIDTLGLILDESLLPLGNTTGWIPPYVLDLGTAFVSG